MDDLNLWQQLQALIAISEFNGGEFIGQILVGILTLILFMGPVVVVYWFYLKIGKFIYKYITKE